MADRIDQGEVALLTAAFEAAPPLPVRAWVRRPSGEEDGPYTMEDGGTATGAHGETEYLYTLEYLTSEAGEHRWRAASATPVSASEGRFGVRRQALTAAAE